MFKVLIIMYNIHEWITKSNDLIDDIRSLTIETRVIFDLEMHIEFNDMISEKSL